MYKLNLTSCSSMDKNVCFVFFLASWFMICRCNNYEKREIAPFTHIAFSDQTIYVAGSGGIVAFHKENLSEISISDYKNNWLLMYVKDGDVVIQCNTDEKNISHCRKLDSNLKSTGVISTFMTGNMKSLPSYTMVPVQVSPLVIQVAVIGASSMEILNKTYGILSLRLDNLTLFGPWNIEIKEGCYIVFKSVIEYNSHVYFFYQMQKDGHVSSRIGKSCSRDDIDETAGKCDQSYGDMPITCTHKTFTFDELEVAIIYDEVLIVSFRNETESVMCKYDLKDITFKFSSREVQHCNFWNSSQHYEETEDYFCRRKDCINRLGGQDDIESNVSVVVGNVSIQSIAILKDRYMDVIYFGTANGQIGMIFITNTPSRSIKFHTIDNMYGKVLTIKIEETGLLILLQNKVQQIQFENCSDHQNCSSCMKSLNPYCGWNLKEKQCDRYNRLNEVAVKWIPLEFGTCYEASVSPKQNRIDGNKLTLNFTVNFDSHFIDACKLRGEIDNFHGVLQPRNHFPLWGCSFTNINLTHDDYRFTLENVEYDTHLIFTENIIEFYHCEGFKTCEACTNRPKCRWDRGLFTCSHFGGSITKEEHCPRVRNIFPSMLHSNFSSNITIDVENLKNVTGITLSNFECEVNQVSDEKKLFRARLHDDMTFVSCIGVNLDEASTPYTIRLKYNGTFYVDNEVKLTVYSCSGLLNDTESCGECQYWIRRGYECQWCNSYPKCYHFTPYTLTCTQFHTKQNCKPIVKKVSPRSGPMVGGTVVTIMGENLGTDGYNISVYINDVECNKVTVIKPFKSLTCVTGKSNTTRVTGIFVSVNESQFSDSSFEYNYMYKIPKIHKFSPEKGILAGNTTITINGSDICFEGKHRYNISLCDSITCIPCSVPSEFECRKAYIRVRTGPTFLRNMTTLKFEIDDFIELHPQRFEYLPDPTIIFSNQTPKALQSGGATFTINGEGFSHVGEITVERVKNPCDVKLDIEAVCQTPEKKQNESNIQSVRVYFDGLTVTVDIEYVDDPQFDNFQSILEYNKESPIKITGTNILHGAIYDDYSIHVGLDGKCIIKDINMTYIICLPPTFTPRTNETDEHTVFVVVEVGRIKAYIGKLRYKVDIDILAIIVGLLAAAFVIAVVVGVFTVFIMKKKKRKVIKEFKLELLTREEMIRKASREEFADAQMTMREIKSDLVTSRVPFRDYQTYVLYQLFPNQDIETNPLLHDSKLTDNQEPKMKNALEKFDQLLSNKVFLKTLVQTLDRKNMLTMQEKAHFSSVLSITLLGNMRLLFDLVNCLLADMIHSSTKKQHKVLFRRFDSITLRLMANWLQIGLYGQLTAHSGMHLFMLYKAVQTIIEMSPIDALTGNAKNTIAEEKLLKMRIEHQPLTLQIDLNGNSDEHYPVRVLDCDTISQVKQKCCAQIYKNKPASERPRIDELTLEWQEGSAGKLILDDIDNISETGNGLVRLNTLKHYMVKDNCKMALMYNHHDDQEVYVNSATFRTESMASEDITLLMPDRNEQENVEIQKWHLETFSSNLPDDEKSNREADFGDIFLNRLFHTKLLLSDYVDSTFEGLLDPQTASISIRYFLWMLDKLGQDAGVEDEVLQSWKTECYATRVWAPLIGKPDILFDVMDTDHVEPCMDILRQVFVESCTQSTHKISKDSSTQKLLFHKDIPRYRKLIGAFFIKLEPVSDQDFLSEMDECSNQQKTELTFSRQATLHQLYNLFIGNYKNEIMEDFEDMEESNDFQFASKLQEIIELMDESSI